jgi:hypothetical protein
VTTKSHIEELTGKNESDRRTELQAAQLETKNGEASSAALWHTDKRRAGLRRQKNHGADLSRRHAEICGGKTLEAKKHIMQQNKI